MLKVALGAKRLSAISDGVYTAEAKFYAHLWSQNVFIINKFT